MKKIIFTFFIISCLCISCNHSNMHSQQPVNDSTVIIKNISNENRNMEIIISNGNVNAAVSCLSGAI